MNALRKLFKRLQAQAVGKAFIGRELAWSLMSRQRRMNILMTDREGWTNVTREKFRFTRHAVAFADIRTATLGDYDLVVPLTIADLQFLDHVRDQIPRNPIPIPDPHCVQLCDDKQRFNALLISKGLGEYIPCIGESLDYPYILKRSIDEAGAHSCIVQDKEQAQALLAIRGDPDYFAQELILGDTEYATHILIRDGAVVCSLNVEYGFDSDMPIKGRDKPAYTLIGHCPYLRIFTLVLVAIGFDGLCCVNYKVRHGKPLIMEINPRFGRSLCGYFFAFIRQLRVESPSRFADPTMKETNPAQALHR